VKGLVQFTNIPRHHKIRTLDLSSEKIDGKLFAKLLKDRDITDLKRLFLNHTQVQDVSALASLPNLQI
jgi:hypothetical protein